MPTLAYVEKKIARIEGFDVTFRYSGPAKSMGRDVRGDREDVPTYSFQRMLKGDATVAAWIETRFTPNFPGYAVEVLNGSGKPVNGRTKLANLRATYD